MSANNNIDLIGQCFYALNSYKRHRALSNIKKEEGKSTDAQYHDLKQYMCIDSLELGLRALQRALYDDKNKEAEETTTSIEIEQGE